MSNRAQGSIIGAIVGTIIGSIGEITRAGIAAALRDAAEEVERGNIVSSEEIAMLKLSADRIRVLQRRSERR